MNYLKSPRPILITALVLGWLGDLFFYGKSLGVSLPLYILLILLALFALGSGQGISLAWPNLWLVVPVMFFAVMVATRANGFLIFLNLMASLSLLALLAHSYAGGWLPRMGLIGYPFTLLESVVNAVAHPAPLIAASTDVMAIRTKTSRRVMPLARGVVLAIPVVGAFTCLLASADLVFASYVDYVVNLEFLPNVLEWIWRGILILGLAWLVAGGFSYAFSRAHGREISFKTAVERANLPAFLGFVEVTTVLVAVDLLFLAFVAIQITYLFGGEATITGAGYTYAEYARQGFFELLTVAVLSLGLILGLHRLGRREKSGQTLSVNSLSSLMIGLVIVILISAFQRMLLYEAAFGYTQLRLYSHVFMVWLAVALVWFMATLWWRPTYFAFGAFVASLGFLVTLNIINPDALIARQNLAREQLRIHLDFADTSPYRGASRLDAYYLTQLSDDAIPVLVAAIAQVDEAQRPILEDHFKRRHRVLKSQLTEQSWLAFHLAERQAYNILTPYASE